MQNKLQAQLDERKLAQRYRTRKLVDSPQGLYVQSEGKTLLNFCSNDYLGLANHPHVKKAFSQASEKYGVGSGASHLVNGHSVEHHKLEVALADFTGRDRALLFSTGYMANLGVITALAGKGAVVVEDKLNHASLLDGALLSRADLVRFKHNDTRHAQRLLDKESEKSTEQTRLVAVDGVFSMDGDFAPLPELATLCQQKKAWLMVDDAHGIGCIGERGAGSCEHFGLNQTEVPVLMGTLGKALGSFGAFVAGSEELIETLIQFSRSYIYTTALPPAVAAASYASLQCVQNEKWRREKLRAGIDYFRKACSKLDLSLMDSQSPIQPIVFGDEEKALAASQFLYDAGVWVSAIRPPTVPVGTARLRVTLSAEHDEEHIDTLVSVLEKFQLMQHVGGKLS